MHQFGSLSERGGWIFEFASERGGTQKGGGVPTLEETMPLKFGNLNKNIGFGRMGTLSEKTDFSN